MCFRHYLKAAILQTSNQVQGWQQNYSCFCNSHHFLWRAWLQVTEPSFTYPRAGCTIKGWAAGPSLYGRALGKHTKQFGFKKAANRLLAEKHLPHLARERNSAAWGWGADQLPEIRLPTRFPMFFLIIAQITICTHTRWLLIRAN